GAGPRRRRPRQGGVGKVGGWVLCGPFRRASSAQQAGEELRLGFRRLTRSWGVGARLERCDPLLQPSQFFDSSLALARIFEVTTQLEQLLELRIGVGEEVGVKLVEGTERTRQDREHLVEVVEGDTPALEDRGLSLVARKVAEHQKPKPGALRSRREPFVAGLLVVSSGQREGQVPTVRHTSRSSSQDRARRVNLLLAAGTGTNVTRLSRRSCRGAFKFPCSRRAPRRCRLVRRW